MRFSPLSPKFLGRQIEEREAIFGMDFYTTGMKMIPVAVPKMVFLEFAFHISSDYVQSMSEGHVGM